MAKIKLLPENLINQIAAGEVIERPASIVKELVENSIDAGSEKIEIEITNECRDIRVSDNGSGISKEDVKLAFSRHATSKLRSENDLWNISTLGFRGEALASIISVSKVECTTRTPDSDTGIRVECENSSINTVETGCAIGTTMKVSDLFYNVPARLKFLKKTQTEVASILEALQSIAIAHTNISITLISKGKAILKTSGSNHLATAISEIYSKDLLNEVVDINKTDKDSNYTIQGVASNPAFTRSNKKAIYTFINGRTVRCPILLKAVDTAYKNLIASGKYPFVVINLGIPTQEIDVNVHPAKKEVRYTNPNKIFNFVCSGIKLALEGGFNAYPVMNDESTFNFNSIEKQDNISTIQSNNNFATQSFGSIAQHKSIDFHKVKEEIKQSQTFYQTPEQSKIDLFIEESTAKPKPKIIGQYFNTYILIEAPNGLQIVDQHIAHERAIYEEIKDKKIFASQLLLTAQSIHLEPSQISTLEENKDLIEKYGYKFTTTDSGIMFTQLPQIIANSNQEKIANELLEALESDIEQIENKILITTSCHAAVKAGEKLSLFQMEDLIIKWMNSDFSQTCPHGRKISHTIPLKEIASFFGRFEQ